MDIIVVMKESTHHYYDAIDSTPKRQVSLVSKTKDVSRILLSPKSTSAHKVTARVPRERPPLSILVSQFVQVDEMTRCGQ